MHLLKKKKKKKKKNGNVLTWGRFDLHFWDVGADLTNFWGRFDQMGTVLTWGRFDMGPF